jgi:hypothetical protein
VESPDSIAIVATGPSLRVEDVKADCVIAVNSAIKLIKPDIWFTLDPSSANIRIMQHPIEGVQYFAAIPPRFVAPEHVTRLERVPETLMKKPPEGTPKYWVWRWKAKFGLSEDKHQIHTGNSAYGALGLAYHMRPKVIHLHGVVGTREERITGGRPNNLDHLPALFESAKPQLDRAGIQVFNHSDRSKIACFAKW